MPKGKGTGSGLPKGQAAANASGGAQVAARRQEKVPAAREDSPGVQPGIADGAEAASDRDTESAGESDTDTETQSASGSDTSGSSSAESGSDSDTSGSSGAGPTAAPVRVRFPRRKRGTKWHRVPRAPSSWCSAYDDDVKAALKQTNLTQLQLRPRGQPASRGERKFVKKLVKRLRRHPPGRSKFMLAIPPARIGEKDKSSKKRRYKLHPKDKSHENVLAKVREMLTSGHEAWKDLLGADLHDWASLAAYFEASGYVDYTDNEAEAKQQGTSKAPGASTTVGGPSAPPRRAQANGGTANKSHMQPAGADAAGRHTRGNAAGLPAPPTAPTTNKPNGVKRSGLGEAALPAKTGAGAGATGRQQPQLQPAEAVQMQPAASDRAVKAPTSKQSAKQDPQPPAAPDMVQDTAAGTAQGVKPRVRRTLHNNKAKAAPVAAADAGVAADADTEDEAPKPAAKRTSKKQAAHTASTAAAEPARIDAPAAQAAAAATGTAAGVRTRHQGRQQRAPAAAAAAEGAGKGEAPKPEAKKRAGQARTTDTDEPDAATAEEPKTTALEPAAAAAAAAEPAAQGRPRRGSRKPAASKSAAGSGVDTDSEAQAKAGDPTNATRTGQGRAAASQAPAEGANEQGPGAGASKARGAAEGAAAALPTEAGARRPPRARRAQQGAKDADTVPTEAGHGGAAGAAEQPGTSDAEAPAEPGDASDPPPQPKAGGKKAGVRQPRGRKAGKATDGSGTDGDVGGPSDQRNGGTGVVSSANQPGLGPQGVPPEQSQTRNPPRTHANDNTKPHLAKHNHPARNNHVGQAGEGRIDPAINKETTGALTTNDNNGTVPAADAPPRPGGQSAAVYVCKPPPHIVLALGPGRPILPPVGSAAPLQAPDHTLPPPSDVNNGRVQAPGAPPRPDGRPAAADNGGGGDDAAAADGAGGEDDGAALRDADAAAPADAADAGSPRVSVGGQRGEPGNGEGLDLDNPTLSGLGMLPPSDLEDEGPEPAAAPGEEVQGVAGLHAPQHDLAAQAAAAGLELRSSNSSVRTEALQRALEQDETGPLAPAAQPPPGLLAALAQAPQQGGHAPMVATALAQGAATALLTGIPHGPFGNAANVEQGGGQAQDATGAVVGPHLQQQQQPGALVQPGLHGWAGELGSVENWWIDLMAEGFNGLATGPGTAQVLAGTGAGTAATGATHMHPAAPAAALANGMQGAVTAPVLQLPAANGQHALRAEPPAAAPAGRDQGRSTAHRAPAAAGRGADHAAAPAPAGRNGAAGPRANPAHNPAVVRNGAAGAAPAPATGAHGARPAMPRDPADLPPLGQNQVRLGRRGGPAQPAMHAAQQAPGQPAAAAARQHVPVMAAALPAAADEQQAAAAQLAQLQQQQVAAHLQAVAAQQHVPFKAAALPAAPGEQQAAAHQLAQLQQQQQAAVADAQQEGLATQAQLQQAAAAQPQAMQQLPAEFNPALLARALQLSEATRNAWLEVFDNARAARVQEGAPESLELIQVGAELNADRFQRCPVTNDTTEAGGRLLIDPAYEPVYGPLHQMAAAQGVINASRQLWSHVTRAMDVFAQPQPGAQVPPGQLLGSMGVNTYSQALGKLVPATNMLIKSVALNQTAVANSPAAEHGNAQNGLIALLNGLANGVPNGHINGVANGVLNGHGNGPNGPINQLPHGAAHDASDGLPGGNVP